MSGDKKEGFFKLRTWADEGEGEIAWLADVWIEIFEHTLKS